MKFFILFLILLPSFSLFSAPKYDNEGFPIDDPENTQAAQAPKPKKGKRRVITTVTVENQGYANSGGGGVVNGGASLWPYAISAAVIVGGIVLVSRWDVLKPGGMGLIAFIKTTFGHLTAPKSPAVDVLASVRARLADLELGTLSRESQPGSTIPWATDSAIHFHQATVLPSGTPGK